MITFGLISEGVTDQNILEDILSGYFGEDEINVNSLQPKITKDKHGHWKINNDKFGNRHLHNIIKSKRLFSQ